MIPFLIPVFFGILLLGLPIFATLALSVMVVLFFFTDITLAIVPQRMFAGMNNFTLMAIPFFILAAELMRVGGLADRLIDLAKVLVGWIPGGLAATAVLSCVFFAAISGSSPATVAAIGKIMIPAMLAAGYSRMFTVGLITTAGTLGPIIPPSITLIIYGAVTGTSIGKLFAAGILPGILLATMLVAYCYISALRANYESSKIPTIREIVIAFRRASWGLGLPVLLLGGIYSGVFTPTESAAAACAYGFFVGIFIYRQIRLKEAIEILRSSGILAGTLLLITAGASSFSWLLASSGVPAQLAGQVLSLTDSPAILLLLFNAVLLVAGCFLDGASAVIVLSPLMEPIASQFGIDSTHFGIITLLNVSVGMVTPPVGLNLFVACAVAGMPIQQVFKATLPTLAILFVALFLITYIPWISTVVPDMMYL